ERFGGQIADALRAHDLTYEWYMAEWPRRLAAGGRLPQDLPRDRGRWAVRLLAEYGRPHEGTEAEVFVLSQELIYTVAARIDVT
ncbi:MAG: hypothetical protein HY334_06410, partial [Armatimonadetes bacterium]|nr:hypothetical protein [Armatimonadota bacterium]